MGIVPTEDLATAAAAMTTTTTTTTTTATATATATATTTTATATATATATMMMGCESGMLYVPVGLVLLFFGAFVARATALAAVGALAWRAGAALASALGVEGWGFTFMLALALPFACATGAAAWAYGCAWFCEPPPPPAPTAAATAATTTTAMMTGAGVGTAVRRGWTGAVWGVAIGATMGGASAVQRGVAALTAGGGLAAVFVAAPVRAPVFLTALAGAFLLFSGMQLLDARPSTPPAYVFSGFFAAFPLLSPAFGPPPPSPATTAHHAQTDLALSVGCFLVVTLLGCAVQLVLIASRAERPASRSHYAAIP